MVEFDVSKPWIILVPVNISSARKDAEEFSRYLELLRRRSGLSLPSPSIIDHTQEPAPEGENPFPGILLNCPVLPEAVPAAGAQNGFTWKAEPVRIEIHGNSPLGLRKGVYHFLSVLGVHWPKPDREILPLPKPGRGRIYTLQESSAYRRDESDPAEKHRFLLRQEDFRKKRASILLWAARIGIDALVLPFQESASRAYCGLIKEAAQYAFDIEAGGRELSALIPRRLFFFNRELFRMEEGKRKLRGFFCPTNPDSIALIRKNAARFFRSYSSSSAPAAVNIFHLWPEEDGKNNHCACPSCRAFSPAEQNRIVVNAVADTLGEINPAALLSYYEPSPQDADQRDDGKEGKGAIRLRRNTFRLDRLPGKERSPLSNTRKPRKPL
jgi:hypothetical protein